MDLLSNLNEVVYESESNDKYTGKDILELAKGNVKYAQLLLDRVEWQSIETLIEEDLMYGEVVEYNDQYILTGGVEIIISEV